jgi:hypothetical protein
MIGLSMRYTPSRTDVTNVVQWLRGRDESQWADQTSLLSETISELLDMSRPITRPDEAGNRSRDPDLLPPGATQINAAMPYLRGMLASMKRHGRDYATEYGEAALELLPEG